MQQSKLNSYRPDIQGLRAVAVISVVLYHAGLSVPGGFVGVDMFFVISGYVVSRLIYSEFCSVKGFSLQRFLIRRIKRLLPILVVVVSLTTLLLTRFFSSFGEVQQATITARWSAGFLANIGLLLEDSYVALKDNPFRHLWSLAVEEQFYLVFPFIFVLYLCAERKSVRSGDRARVYMVLLVSFSLLICVAFSLSDSELLQKISFFSMPTRMWQFFTGVGVTLIERSFRLAPSRSMRLVSVACLFGIGWSFWIFREWSTFPGLWAVIPTLATAGLILTSVPGSLLQWMLSRRQVTLVGDVSYGWYLWHWPIIVIVHRLYGDELLPSVSAVLGSLVVAVATYAVIENPIRNHSISGRSAFVIAALVSATMLIVPSVVKNAAEATEARALDPQYSSITFDVVNGLAPRDTLLTLRTACNEVDRSVEEIVKNCSNDVQTATATVLLLGDSHAASVGDGLFAAGEELGIRVTGFYVNGCPIADGFSMERDAICALSVSFRMALVRQLKPDIVVIANSYVTYLTGELPADLIVGNSADIEIPSNLRSNSVALVGALQSRVDEIVRGGSRVVILEEVPFAVMPRTDSTDEMWAHNRLRDVVNVELHQRFYENGAIDLVDASTALCGSSPSCALDRDGQLQYWHKTHLNRVGSLRLTSFWRDVFKVAVAR
jgi:peptidoglycan/LPS O-acetylase OafA/YrhL